MNGFQWAGLVILGLLVLYLVVRLGSAAWFRSKHEYDNWKRKPK